MSGNVGDTECQSLGRLDIGDRDDVLDSAVGERLPHRTRGAFRGGTPGQADGMQAAGSVLTDQGVEQRARVHAGTVG